MKQLSNKSRWKLTTATALALSMAIGAAGAAYAASNDDTAGAEANAKAQANIEAKANVNAAAGLEAALDFKTEAELEAAVVAQEEEVRKSPKNAEAVLRLGQLLHLSGKTELKAFVNGKQPNFDVQPIVKEGRTLVPFRAIAASLGADVNYDANTKVVTVVRGEQTVELKLDSATAIVNGAEVQLDVKAQAVQGRTVIPLRFIGEALGADVKFHAESKTIIVTDR